MKPTSTDLMMSEICDGIHIFTKTCGVHVSHKAVIIKGINIQNNIITYLELHSSFDILNLLCFPKIIPQFLARI